MFFVELLVSSVMQPNYQPFYAENISLSTLSNSDNTNFQSAQDGAIGGGIVLANVYNYFLVASLLTFKSPPLLLTFLHFQ